MAFIDILLTTIINSIPIAILFLPYFFIKKKALSNLYLRIYAGILIFYLIYWVLPIIFQVRDTPIELELQSGEEGDLALGIGYIISHFTALLTSFASYPFATLPFIFFISPFISMIIVWNRLRKEEGTIQNNLNLIAYQVSESPSKRIREGLIRNDWKREKEILKLLIVLLPVSLYLLQVIIKISGTEASLQSSLGWFLEILFVYIATFIFSIELLFSSQISLKGKFFGERVREQTYKSLYTVGVPISIISLLLFVADNISSNSLDTLPVIIYFFAYFIMASVIFILFLKVFEPISILIFIKLIDWWRNRQKREKSVESNNKTYVALYGAIAIAAYFLYYLLIGGLIIPQLSDKAIIDSANFISPTPNPTLVNSINFEILVILGFANILVSTLVIGFIISRGLKYITNIRLGFYIYLPILVLISVFVSGDIVNWVMGQTDEFWITGQTSFTSVFGFDFFILRSAIFDAELVGVTYILSIPYLFSRYIFNVIIWSLLIHYVGKEFKSKNIKLEEDFVEKIVFSTISEFPSYNDYIQGKTSYLISRKEEAVGYDTENEREEILDLLKSMETDQFLNKIKPDDNNEKRRFYFTLKYLYRNRAIEIWKPEYSYKFEQVEKQGLYIIYDDGRGVFNYAFRSDEIQDPGLVSGMFSAITSFVKEMTKSTEVLKKIDHGDITILLEYGSKIFGALFIKGTESSEVRAPLKEFVQKFEQKYGEVLRDWTGALVHFKDDENNKLVESIFEED
ncbi:MAG: hypothetical protein KGD58_15300 [Candidatus Lokiarchaeota archaeon]|nr:hypothetical protein [Candidatus Lokiarchaeota archaeon]